MLDKIVLVVRKTRLEGLIERFNSRAQAKFYLDHPDDRERIRQAGLARARRDHSWQKRFTDVFRTIGLS